MVMLAAGRGPCQAAEGGRGPAVPTRQIPTTRPRDREEPRIPSLNNVATRPYDGTVQTAPEPGRTFESCRGRCVIAGLMRSPTALPR